MLSDPDFTTGSYTVTRTAAPTFDDDGVAVDGTSSTFTTGPSILRPLGGSDLEALPEGYHVSDTRKLLTTATLRVGKGETPPDAVTVRNEAGVDERWVVIGIGTTVAFGETWSRVLLARSALP